MGLGLASPALAEWKVWLLKLGSWAVKEAKRSASPTLEERETSTTLVGLGVGVGVGVGVGLGLGLGVGVGVRVG